MGFQCLSGQGRSIQDAVFQFQGFEVSKGTYIWAPGLRAHTRGPWFQS